jgi:FAD/FMN-containing dehydrogenase/Fe-S oxidoreductase
MDIEKKRIEDDLRGVIRGDVYCDELTAQLYASDASIYQIPPLGVIRPRSAADVAACVKYSVENGLSVHPRGAGSGVAGESLGRGLVVDFSRYLRRWHRDAALGSNRVRVQSGIVLASLNRELAADGRQYGPDPATRSVTTMGSVLSINASGSHFLRSGSARDTVKSIEFVTASGDVVELSEHHPGEPTIQGRFAHGVTEIVRAYQPQLDAYLSRSALGNGIRFDGVIDREGKVDLAKLVVGTQGVLGLITEATVDTEPIAAHRGVILLFFSRLESAAKGAVAAVGHGIVACDLMDRRLLEIARETEPAFAKLLPRDAEAMVLIELQGESLSHLQDRMAAIEEELCQPRGLAASSIKTVDRHQRDLFWALSRRVVPRLYRVKGDQSPVAIVEDVRIPPESMPIVLIEIQEVLKRHQVTATIFAHAGHGHLHIRPFLNLASERDCALLKPLSAEIAAAVWRLGGAVGTEHAAGLSRSWLLERQYGELWPAIQKLKRLFDPLGIMNPGKLAGDSLYHCDENIRPVSTEVEVVGRSTELIPAGPSEQLVAEASGNPVRKLPVLQQWGTGRQIEQVVRACNGCGRCRTTAPDQRQCPMFRILPAEEASPRAKANLLRGVLTGALDPNDLALDRAKEIADLCFGCHQCRLECPASVDIPKIVNEIKAQYVATNGLKLSDLLASRIDRVSAFASRVPWLANYLISSPMWRWVLERTFGLSRARELPSVASQTFIRYAAKRQWTRVSRHGGTKVVYFVDHYANYHDVDLGRALAEVLQHNQIGLYVPPRQGVSGMARIAAGDMNGAVKIAKRNVRILAEAVRQGYTIITTEPAAALCLRREYLNLLDNEDAILVSKNTQEACRYLWDLHQQNRLSLDFKPITAEIAYHQPCHVRAIDDGEPGPKLMRLIPGLNVQEIHRGCSGMAGTWGLRQKNYRNSLRIGWPLISAMRKTTAQAAATECSSCKMQIEHGSGRATLHPLKLLAYAYGRMPRIEKELNAIP